MTYNIGVCPINEGQFSSVIQFVKSQAWYIEIYLFIDMYNL